MTMAAERSGGIGAAAKRARMAAETDSSAVGSSLSPVVRVDKMNGCRSLAATNWR